MTDLRKILDEATPGPWTMKTVRTSCGICHKIGPFPHEWYAGSESHACLYDDYPPKPDGFSSIRANARLIALAPQLAAALIKAEEALAPFSEMAGEMFASNWNDDGVAVSFITKNGPLRLTFKEFRKAHAALSEISALTGGLHD